MGLTTMALVPTANPQGKTYRHWYENYMYLGKHQSATTNGGTSPSGSGPNAAQLFIPQEMKLAENATQ